MDDYSNPTDAALDNALRKIFEIADAGSGALTRDAATELLTAAGCPGDCVDEIFRVGAHCFDAATTPVLSSFPVREQILTALEMDSKKKTKHAFWDAVSCTFSSDGGVSLDEDGFKKVALAANGDAPREELTASVKVEIAKLIAKDPDAAWTAACGKVSLRP